MNNFLKEEKFSFHLIFLFVLSLYYLIPYFFTGQLILKPSDILDGEIVYNHIIGKFYRGEPESIDLFIGGEIKWYFLRRILQPLTLLYAFFETETAFWVTDIIVKLICYISFFKLAKKLKCSNFNSSLVGCLYACSIYSWTHFGIGIAAFPYLIYLLVKNKDLKLRNYFIISFIGLNSDLATDFFVLPLLFAIFLIFCFKNLKSNFQIFLKISILFIFFILLSNANMIYSLLIDLPFHRNTMIYPDISLTENCKRFFYNFLSIPYFNRVYFFHDIPYTFFSAPIVLFSLFNANKETRLFLLIIFLMCLVYFILNLNYINFLRNNVEGLFSVIFKSIKWEKVTYFTPIFYSLLFINIVNSKIFNKIKFIIYTSIFVCLLTSQISVSIVPLGKYLISFDKNSIYLKNEINNNFYNKDYVLLFKNLLKLKKDKLNNFDKQFQSYYTFRGYYDYENYRHIKSIVGSSRTLSIGKDPMVAVMNDIKVIDGYHNFYPLSYKVKFRKVIENQLSHYKEFENYYSVFGSRLYTFVSDPDVIKINFNEAKLLGAEFVISKYKINNQMLIPICENCNNTSDFFIYKISI